MSKNIVSNILMEPREWKRADVEQPDVGQLVVIRMTNPQIIYSEDDNEIYPSEDMKIGKFVRNVSDPSTGVWAIAPPHPRFDYSPLSNKDQLNEGTIVTHWAVPEEGEIEGWETRFDPAFVYKTLRLEVDQEHLESVYRALSWGATFIQKCNPQDPEAKRLAYFLYDMQYVLDTGKPIIRTDEEYEKAMEEKKKELEIRRRQMEKEQAIRAEEAIEKMERDRREQQDALDA